MFIKTLYHDLKKNFKPGKAVRCWGLLGMQGLCFAGAPVAITLENTVIEENSPAGKVIGKFDAADPDTEESHSYKLIPEADGSKNDNAHFEVTSSEYLSVASGANLDYESRHLLVIRVEVTDKTGNTFNQALQITLTDINEPPEDIGFDSELVVEENQPTGTNLGRFSLTDHDSGRFGQEIAANIMDDVKTMTGGWRHTLIVKKDGSLWGNGYNGWGQLGDGTTADRDLPV